VLLGVVVGVWLFVVFVCVCGFFCGGGGVVMLRCVLVFVNDDSFICVARLIHMCDMPHPYV